MPKRRVLVIGLDCLTPQLTFDQFLPHLPTFQQLMSKGMWGAMRSTDPPITVPAWASMTTGKDPGQLGIYGFNAQSKRVELISLHPGETIDSARQNSSFELLVRDTVEMSPTPPDEYLKLLREEIDPMGIVLGFGLALKPVALALIKHIRCQVR